MPRPKTSSGPPGKGRAADAEFSGEALLQQQDSANAPQPRRFVHRWRSGVFNAALSSTQKLVLLALPEWSDAEGRNCHPSVGSIARLTGVNEKTVRRVLSHPAVATWFRRSVRGTVADAIGRANQGWRLYAYRLHLPEGADTTPARAWKGADSLPGPSQEGEDTTPAPRMETCGHSGSKVRTFAPEGAGTVPDELALELVRATGEEQELSLAPLAEPATRFAEFWTAYPRKVGSKAKTEKSWTRQKLDRHADRILADVAARIARDPQWRDRQFVPHPITYIGNQRWLDEWEPQTATVATQPQPIDVEQASALNRAAAARLGVTS